LNFANIASRTIPNESKLTFEEFSVSLKNDDDLKAALVGHKDITEEFRLIYFKGLDRVYKTSRVYLKMEIQKTSHRDFNHVQAMNKMVKMSKDAGETHVAKVIFSKLFRLEQGLDCLVTATLAAGLVNTTFRRLVPWKQMTLYEIHILIHDLTHGLEYIHKKLNLAHRDFHPTNTVYSSQTRSWTIIDFDHSTDLNPKKKLYGQTFSFIHHQSFKEHTYPGLYEKVEHKNGSTSRKKSREAYMRKFTDTPYVLCDRFQCIMTILQIMNLPQNHNFYKKFNLSDNNNVSDLISGIYYGTVERDIFLAILLFVKTMILYVKNCILKVSVANIWEDLVEQCGHNNTLYRKRITGPILSKDMKLRTNLAAENNGAFYEKQWNMETKLTTSVSFLPAGASYMKNGRIVY